MILHDLFQIQSKTSTVEKNVLVILYRFVPTQEIKIRRRYMLIIITPINASILKYMNVTTISSLFAAFDRVLL